MINTECSDCMHSEICKLEDGRANLRVETEKLKIENPKHHHVFIACDMFMDKRKSEQEKTWIETWKPLPYVEKRDEYFINPVITCELSVKEVATKITESLAKAGTL